MKHTFTRPANSRTPHASSAGERGGVRTLVSAACVSVRGLSFIDHALSGRAKVIFRRSLIDWGSLMGDVEEEAGETLSTIGMQSGLLTVRESCTQVDTS